MGIREEEEDQLCCGMCRYVPTYLPTYRTYVATDNIVKALQAMVAALVVSLCPVGTLQHKQTTQNSCDSPQRKVRSRTSRSNALFSPALNAFCVPVHSYHFFTADLKLTREKAFLF